jgi:uncharacterized membrane protein YfcA
MFFETAGIDVPLWLPPLTAFVISFFTSMVGVSGAFLLLPFQMSVLNYVAPSVSATNLVFNLVAIPSGVWRAAREGRMDWLLARIIVLGTLPGLLAGWWLRVHWLADPRGFKLFVGLVLGWLALKMLGDLRRRHHPVVARPDRRRQVRSVFLLALGIGVIGGAYGIGGGALMAPVLVGVLGLSVHAVAGATLFGTFVTSVVGVLLYQFMPAPAGMETRPDWLLGLMFGIGGAGGMYLGVRTQKYISQRALKFGMATVLAVLASSYIVGF